MFSRKKKADINSSVEHPSLGKINVRKTSRASRISVSVRPGGEIRLTLPHSVPAADGIRFLNSKLDWIHATKHKHGEKITEHVIEPPYTTRNHRLELRPAVRDNINIRVADGVIRVSYPDNLGPENKSLQTAIRKGIESAWRTEANELLPGRVAQLSKMTGLKSRSVTVRNTVSKWGSCSARDDLSLSLHLMRLPDHLIDYIILHELCHTVHKNHGPRFHSLLDKVTGGNHQKFRKELLNYRTRW